MQARAEARAEETGRHTSIEHIRKSKARTPKSVQKLGVKAHLDRVRLVDNSADDRQPKVVYDSEEDQAWQEGRPIDVDKYVDK